MSARVSSRVNMRIAPGVLEMIDEAAEVQGIDRTAFFIDAAATRARAVLSEDSLRVTAAEVAQIKRLLDEAPEANVPLREAAARLQALGL